MTIGRADENESSPSASKAKPKSSAATQQSQYLAGRNRRLDPATAPDQVIRSFPITSWSEVSTRVRLRLPSRLGWVLVRTSPDDHPKNRSRAERLHTVSDLPPATTVLSPFIDVGRGVVEARSALVARWEQAGANVYQTAIDNLRSIVDPEFHTVWVRGCRLCIVEAGYWTTGFAYDFDRQLLAILESQDVQCCTDCQVERTLLIGARSIIWCCNHSGQADSQHECAIYPISADLSQSAGSSTSRTTNYYQTATDSLKSTDFLE